jgi:hypothetical protein
MKKLVLSAMLSAFVAGSFSAAYACDGKNHDKASGSSASAKKQEKKSDEASGATKSDQKS